MYPLIYYMKDFANLLHIDTSFFNERQYGADMEEKIVGQILAKTGKISSATLSGNVSLATFNY
ncbi:MAG: hypothetical protein ACR2PY_04320, partial [Salinispira sp.]